MTLNIKFNFSDWENQTVNKFRNEIINYIGLQNTRTTLLLSSELTKDGVSFFIVTTNTELGAQIQSKYSMTIVSEDYNHKDLIIEYGNSELYKK